jgi:hypothetical protein
MCARESDGRGFLLGGAIGEKRKGMFRGGDAGYEALRD